jgi:dUTP pyrophosphatase
MHSIQVISSSGRLPTRGTPQSAGYDLEAYIDKDIVIGCGCTTLIPTGLKVAIPDGYELQIRPRSGIALKNGITVLNTPGTIDADYRGEIGVILVNHGNEPFVVKPQMKIAQMVMAKVETVKWIPVDKLDDTERKGGFGHTGM